MFLKHATIKQEHPVRYLLKLAATSTLSDHKVEFEGQRPRRGLRSKSSSSEWVDRGTPHRSW